MPKNTQTTCPIALISHNSKVMLKILQGRLQQYVNCEPPDVQAGFRECRGTRDQIPNIRGIIEKAREFQETSAFALLTMPKPLTVWITINCGKFLKRNINNLRYADDITLMAESEEPKSLLLKVKEENEKVGLKQYS